MFEAITTAGTGLTTYHTWLDAIANNVANVNDVSATNQTPFQAQYVQATAIQGVGADGIGRGVEVTALPEGSATGIEVQDPTNPIADKNGYVLRPDVDLSQQMGDMIMAQRAFQANAEVVTNAKQTYESAIEIGKGMTS
jgi:flagellar basal-body rod protein FlgC